MGHWALWAKKPETLDDHPHPQNPTAFSCKACKKKSQCITLRLHLCLRFR